VSHWAFHPAVSLHVWWKVVTQRLETFYSAVLVTTVETKGYFSQQFQQNLKTDIYLVYMPIPEWITSKNLCCSPSGWVELWIHL
jgi:hypothetical protein